MSRVIDMRRQEDRQSFLSSVTVIGVGAIGSHLVNILARSPTINKLTLVDHDRFEARNVGSQDICMSDVRRPKALVLADRVRSIAPAKTVTPIVSDVQRVPAGRLNNDLIVTCLDTRSVRQYCAELAWRLGKPLIDLAIEATGLLLRCEVYFPTADSPCLICPWDQADFAALEQTYACQPAEDGRVPATNAPPALAAAAAAIGAQEIEKFASGREGASLAGKQLMIDLLHHRLFVTEFRRRADCEFNHLQWSWERLELDVDRACLGQLLEAVQRRVSSLRSWSVPGHSFVRYLFCGPCADRGPAVDCLDREIDAARRKCPNCGSERLIRGIDRSTAMSLAEITDALRERPLRDFGIRNGDVVEMTPMAGAAAKQFMIEPATAGSPPSAETIP